MYDPYTIKPIPNITKLTITKNSSLHSVNFINPFIRKLSCSLNRLAPLSWFFIIFNFSFDYFSMIFSRFNISNFPLVNPLLNWSNFHRHFFFVHVPVSTRLFYLIVSTISLSVPAICFDLFFKSYCWTLPNLITIAWIGDQWIWSNLRINLKIETNISQTKYFLFYENNG